MAERIIEFSEVSMRKIGDVKEALAIFLPQNYGYKQIVKAYFEAYEISDGRGNTFSVAPYLGKDINAVYNALPAKFTQALPIEVAQKQASLFSLIAKKAEAERRPLKEVAKEYFKKEQESDGGVRPRPPFDEDLATRS